MPNAPGWRRLFRLPGGRSATEVEEEISFHLSMRVEDLVRRGVPEAEARAQAAREFGDAEGIRGELVAIHRARARRENRASAWDELGQDLRFAVRTLLRSPGFAAVVLLTLALGIGANTVLFSVIDAVMLRSLPVVEPDELVHVTMAQRQGTFTNPLWEELRRRQDVLAPAFAYANRPFDLADGGVVRPVAGNLVTGEFFPALGVRPAIGRLPGPSDDYVGCPPVAALGHGLWRREYGGDPTIVGRAIALDGHRFEIVGVVERGFSGVEVGRSVEVFAPLCARSVFEGGEGWRALKGAWFLRIMGRRADGVTTAQAAASLAALAPSIFRATLPADFSVSGQRDYLVRTLTAVDARTGYSDLRFEYGRALVVLMGVVGIVLLIACGNVANLLFARGTVRRREFAIRLAVGAARGRILRQLVTESLLLSTLGAIIGLFFVEWAGQLLVGILSTNQNAIALDLTINARVLAFTAGTATAVGLLFGMAPAWQILRGSAPASAVASDRSTPELAHRGMNRALVSGQIALSLVLIVSAGLLLGTFRTLATVDTGFVPEGVLLVDMDLEKASYTPGQLSSVKRGLLERLRRVPGVIAAAASEMAPLGGTWNGTVRGENLSAPIDEMVYFNAVSDGFFGTLHTPLLAGRDFDATDRPESPRVAVINETMAERYFPGTGAVGGRFRTAGPDASWITVVGVVGDTKYETLREDPLPVAYFPMTQAGFDQPRMSLELRAGGDPSSLVPPVRAVAEEVDPRISLRFSSLSDEIDASLARERLLALVSGFFGMLALILASGGVYGTIAYAVARRQKEFGIRRALGAERSRLVRMVLREVGRLVWPGVILGGLAAFLVTPTLASLLYGLSPSDPRVLAMAAGMLAVVAFAAGALPAWRATQMDPVRALREE